MRDEKSTAGKESAINKFIKSGSRVNTKELLFWMSCAFPQGGVCDRITHSNLYGNGKGKNVESDWKPVDKSVDIGDNYSYEAMQLPPIPSVKGCSHTGKDVDPALCESCANECVNYSISICGEEWNILYPRTNELVQKRPSRRHKSEHVQTLSASTEVVRNLYPIRVMLIKKYEALKLAKDLEMMAGEARKLHRELSAELVYAKDSIVESINRLVGEQGGV